MSVCQCAHVCIWEHLYSPLSMDVCAHTHTHMLVGACPSPGTRGFYCAGSMLGAELSCTPWGQQGPAHRHVSAQVSHCDLIPQQGTAPLQLQKQGPVGRICPGVQPAAPARMAAPRMVLSPGGSSTPTCTETSVSGLAPSTAPGAAGRYRQLVPARHKQIQAGEGLRQEAAGEPGTGTG